MPTEWHGDEYRRTLEARLLKNMKAASLYLAGQAKRKINRGNPTGKFPSLPGEPPKKVTARLFQSVTGRAYRDTTAIVGVFGTNVEYARRLELGFVGIDGKGRNVSQAPRPFLRPTLAEEVDTVIRILARE